MSTPRSRTRPRCCSSSARSRAGCAGARHSRRSTTSRCSARWRSGRTRSARWSGFRSSSRARSRSRPRVGRVRWCSRCRRTCSSTRPTSTTHPPPAGAGGSRPGGAGTRPRAARRGRAPVRARRRPAVDGCRSRRPAGVLRGELAARGRLLPLPGLRRQPLAVVRRPRRDRARSAARGARARGGRPARVGDRLGEITTSGTRWSRRRVRPRPDSRPRGRGGARPRSTAPALGVVASPARSRRRSRLAPLDRCALGVEAGERTRDYRRQPRTTPRLPGQVDMVQVMAAMRERLLRTRSSRTARGISPSGPTVSTSFAALGPGSPRRAGRWATASAAASPGEGGAPGRRVVWRWRATATS